jgi:hypothetical protein
MMESLQISPAFVKTHRKVAEIAGNVYILLIASKRECVVKCVCKFNKSGRT